MVLRDNIDLPSFFRVSHEGFDIYFFPVEQSPSFTWDFLVRNASGGHQIFSPDHLNLLKEICLHLDRGYADLEPKQYALKLLNIDDIQENQ